MDLSMIPAGQAVEWTKGERGYSAAACALIEANLVMVWGKISKKAAPCWGAVKKLRVCVANGAVAF